MKLIWDEEVMSVERWVKQDKFILFTHGVILKLFTLSYYSMYSLIVKSLYYVNVK